MSYRDADQVVHQKWPFKSAKEHTYCWRVLPPKLTPGHAPIDGWQVTNKSVDCPMCLYMAKPHTYEEIVGKEHKPHE